MYGYGVPVGCRAAILKAVRSTYQPKLNAVQRYEPLVLIVHCLESSRYRIYVAVILNRSLLCRPVTRRQSKTKKNRILIFHTLHFLIMMLFHLCGGATLVLIFQGSPLIRPPCVLGSTSATHCAAATARSVPGSAGCAVFRPPVFCKSTVRYPPKTPCQSHCLYDRSCGA